MACAFFVQELKELMAISTLWLPSFCISSAVIVILPGAMCGLWLALALSGYCLEKAFWSIV
jgi:hypothetical protein